MKKPSKLQVVKDAGDFRKGEVLCLEDNIYVGEKGEVIPAGAALSMPSIFMRISDEPTIKVRFFKDYEFNLSSVKGNNTAMISHNAYMMAMDMLIEEIPQAENDTSLFEFEIVHPDEQTEDKELFSANMAEEVQVSKPVPITTYDVAANIAEDLYDTF